MLQSVSVGWREGNESVVPKNLASQPPPGGNPALVSAATAAAAADVDSVSVDD